jgi:hypothetical protein
VLDGFLRAKIQSRGEEIIYRNLRVVGKLSWGIAPISFLDRA